MATSEAVSNMILFTMHSGDSDSTVSIAAQIQALSCKELVLLNQIIGLIDLGELIKDQCKKFSLVFY